MRNKSQVPTDETYNRRLLLHGSKRNQILTLAEIEQYGLHSFGDRDYVSVYGMRPREWYARGIRLLGRTAYDIDERGHDHGILLGTKNWVPT